MLVITWDDPISDVILIKFCVNQSSFSKQVGARCFAVTADHGFAALLLKALSLLVEGLGDVLEIIEKQ